MTNGTMARVASLPTAGDPVQDEQRCHHAVDLAEATETAYIATVTGGDQTLGKSLRAKLRAMEAELGMDGSGPLERLLVRRISLTWLQVHHLDLLLAQVGPENLRDMKYVGGMRNRAHRRMLTAIKSLATIRKLLPTDGHGAGNG